MALEKCTECGREISSDAEVCPLCGVPRKPISLGCIGKSILAVLVIAVYTVANRDVKLPSPLADNRVAPAEDERFAANSPEKRTPHPPRSVTPLPQQRVEPAPNPSAPAVTVGNYPASQQEHILDRALTYSAVNDRAAIKTLLRSGDLVILDSGKAVQVLQSKLFSGKIKIRPIGKTIELWTVAEAVTSQTSPDSTKATNKDFNGHVFNKSGFCTRCGWERDFVMRTQRRCVK